PRRWPGGGANPTSAASPGSADNCSEATSAPGCWLRTRAISAEGASASPRGCTVMTPGLSAFSSSSSKLRTPPVTPTIASTTPAVMPKNQCSWKTALRSVVTGSGLAPAPQQVVVDARQAQQRAALRTFAGELLDAGVELQQQLPLRLVAHKALHPEERRHARTAGHRRDPVQAARGIRDQVAGRELHLVLAVGVVHHQLAAVVFVRVGEEQGAGHVAAQAGRRLASGDRHCHHRAVDMEAVLAAA